MDELKEARTHIEEIDREMARLFEARMRESRTIAAYKRQNGLPVRDAAREEVLIARDRAYITDGATEEYYVPFLRNVMDLSCAYQERLNHGRRVAYSGTEGAYAYAAARRMFPEAEPEAMPDFASAWAAVERGDYDCAVLPIENSYAGEVGAVMDLMFSGTLSVNEVLNVPIVHNLLALPGARCEDIRRVISHPQALSQCAEYIRRHGYESEAYSNTALAAQYVAQAGDPALAAIASEESAALCGLTVLDGGINDTPSNTTRFAAFSRAANRPTSVTRRDEENFLLVFTVRNEAGALAGALNIIGAHNFNMRSVRSRPMKDLPWNYYFYIEAEGNVHTEEGESMLRELSAVCAKLRLCGSYAAGAAR